MPAFSNDEIVAAELALNARVGWRLAPVMMGSILPLAMRWIEVGGPRLWHNEASGFCKQSAIAAMTDAETDTDSEQELIYHSESTKASYVT